MEGCAFVKITKCYNSASHFTNFDDLNQGPSISGARLDDADKVAHPLLTLHNYYNWVITVI